LLTWYKDTLAKLLRQNTKIITKLDVIITKQQALEERVVKIEEICNNKSNDNNKVDLGFIQVRFHYKKFNTKLYVGLCSL